MTNYIPLFFTLFMLINSCSDTVERKQNDSLTKNNLVIDDNDLVYIDKIYILSELTKKYIDTLSNRESSFLQKDVFSQKGTTIYKNNEMYNIGSEIMLESEKEMLISVIKNVDSTAYVWIVIPFSETFDYDFRSDNLLSNAIDMKLDDDEWTNIFTALKDRTKFSSKYETKSNISMFAEKSTFKQSNLGAKLKNVKPSWLGYTNDKGLIKGRVIFYREKIPNQENDLQISVWLPHRE